MTWSRRMLPSTVSSATSSPPSFPPPLFRHSRLARESIRRPLAGRPASGGWGWFGALCWGRGWVWVPACAGTTEMGSGGGGEGVTRSRPHAAQHRLFRHFLSSVIPASSLPSFPPCAGIHSATAGGAACERGLGVVWGFVLGTGLGLGSRVRGNDGDGERGRRRRGDSVTPACCPAPSLPPLPLLRHSRLLSSVIPALRGNPFGDRWRGGLRAGAGGGLGLCAGDGVGFGFPRARERRRWGVGTRGGGG